MKILKSIIVTLLFSFTAQFAGGQTAVQLENSLLWKVEHPDLEKPSYIFGTLHMMCIDDFKLPEKLINTIAEVEALVLEINMTDPAEMKSMQESITNSKKISEELSTVQFSRLDTLVQRVVGTSLVNLDSYGLSMLNSMLIMKMLPCTEIKSFELELTQIALSERIPIYNLETVAEQLAMMQLAFPTESAYEQMMLHDAYKVDFQKAIISYKKEELTEAVSYLTKTEYMDENAVTLIQVDRNKKWVEKMSPMMQERSNLFAVGAAHLTNDFGVIHLLREKGYTVTPVFN
ncbi:TraB/GumN family protein [Peijinzhouia sedimentorum]